MPHEHGRTSTNILLLLILGLTLLLLLPCHHSAVRLLVLLLHARTGIDCFAAVAIVSLLETGVQQYSGTSMECCYLAHSSTPGKNKKRY